MILKSNLTILKLLLYLYIPSLSNWLISTTCQAPSFLLPRLYLNTTRKYKLEKLTKNPSVFWRWKKIYESIWYCHVVSARVTLLWRNPLGCVSLAHNIQETLVNLVMSQNGLSFPECVISMFSFLMDHEKLEVEGKLESLIGSHSYLLVCVVHQNV